MKGLVIRYRLLDLYVGDSGAAAVLDGSVTVGDVLSSARAPSAALGVVDVAQKQHVVRLPQEGMPAASLAAPCL